MLRHARSRRPRPRRRPSRRRRRTASRQGSPRARANDRLGPRTSSRRPEHSRILPSARRLMHGPCSRCAVAGGRRHSAVGQHGGIADDSAPAIVNTVIASGADHIGEHDTRRSRTKCQRSHRCKGGAALRFSRSEVDCCTPTSAPTRPRDAVREGPETTTIDHSRSPAPPRGRRSTRSRLFEPYATLLATGVVVLSAAVADDPREYRGARRIAAHVPVDDAGPALVDLAAARELRPRDGLDPRHRRSIARRSCSHARDRRRRCWSRSARSACRTCGAATAGEARSGARGRTSRRRSRSSSSRRRRRSGGPASTARRPRRQARWLS